jgi:hypothetical protein
MNWSRLNLALAALSFLALLFGIGARDWAVIVPAGVMSLVFGLEWVGVPVLGRWRRRQEREEPPAEHQAPTPPGRREHVGPYWKAAQRQKAQNPAPPARSKLAKRPPNSRARPRRESRW